MPHFKKIAPVKCESYWKRNLLIGMGVFLVLAILIGGNAWVYRMLYNGKIFPGVYVGQYHFGGMTELEAKDFIENFNNRIATESLDFNLKKDDASQSFKFSAVSTDDSSVEMIKLNSDS